MIQNWPSTPLSKPSSNFPSQNKGQILFVTYNLGRPTAFMNMLKCGLPKSESSRSVFDVNAVSSFEKHSGFLALGPVPCHLPFPSIDTVL